MEKTTSGYFPPGYVTLKMLQERRLREKQQRQEEEEELQRAAAASAEVRQLSISRASRKPQDPRPPSIPYPASNHTEVIRQPPAPFRSKNPMSDAAANDRTPQIAGASPDPLPKGVKKRKRPRRKVKKLKSVGKEEGKKLAEDDDTLAEDSYWKDPNRWQERGKYWPVDPRDVFRPEPNKEKEIVEKIAELKVSEGNQTPIGGREVRVRGGRPVDGMNSGSRGYGGFSSRGRPVDGSNSGSRGYGGFSSRGRPAGAAMVWVKKTTSS